MDKQNVKKRLARRFTGKTAIIIDRSTPEKEAESKRERHFYQRMLRAYHAGKEYFYFGRAYHPATRKIEQVQYKVLQEYYEV